MKTNDLLETIETPAGLEVRLETLIDRLAEAEKQKERKLYWWLSGLAAGMAILLSIGIFLHSDNQKTQMTQTVYTLEEQELACRETQKALLLVSQNFNKGINHLTLAVNEIEKSNNIINKTLKR
jgi:hypothetical protein